MNICEINKTVRLGSIQGWTRRGKETLVNVYCKIKYREGKLSITGVEGPLPSGDALGSCGQIVMGLEPCAFVDFAPGWDEVRVAEFLEIWDKWHLNDMRAGSPAQMRYLEEHPIEVKYPENHYDKACEVLAAAGLHPDPGYQIPRKEGEAPEPYRYGSAWLRVDVLEPVLEWLNALPDTDKQPAWV